ncbi:MAG: hypothetical protein KF742_01680 [Cryobacterium sp.]|nr:hypothetical protein [Cryobacterium sp.]
MATSCQVTVLSRDEANAADMKDYVVINPAQMREMYDLSVQCIPFVAMSALLQDAIFSAGITMLTSKGRKPSAAVRAQLAGPWMTFARQAHRDLLRYGICVCVISPHGALNVLPLQLAELYLRTDPRTGERTYRLVVGSSVGAASSMFDGFVPFSGQGVAASGAAVAPAAPKANTSDPTKGEMGQTAQQLMNGALAFLFETAPPSFNGSLECPARSLVADHRYVQMLTNMQLVAAVRRSVPPIYVQGSKPGPAQTEPNAPADFLQPNDLLRGRLDRERGLDDERAAALQQSLAQSRADADAAALQLDAQRARELDRVYDPVTGSITYPAGRFARAYWAPIIRIPPDHQLVNAPSVVPNEPGDLREAVEDLEAHVAEVLGVPLALVSAQRRMTTNQVNQTMMNMFYLAQKKHKLIMESVLRLLALRIFGPDLSRFGTLGKRKRVRIPLMKFRAPVSDGMARAKAARSAAEGEVLGLHRPGGPAVAGGRVASLEAAFKRSLADGGEKNHDSNSERRQEEALDGGEEGEEGAPKGEGEEKESDEEEVTVVAVDEEALEEMEEINVMLNGHLDPVVAWEQYMAGTISWKTYLQLGPHDGYGIPLSLLEDERLDPETGRPLREVIEEEQKRRDAEVAAKGGGGATGRARPGSAPPTSGSAAGYATARRRGADQQQSATDREKRERPQGNAKRAAK